MSAFQIARYEHGHQVQLVDADGVIVMHSTGTVDRAEADRIMAIVGEAVGREMAVPKPGSPEARAIAKTKAQP